jgi:hypothetical protein
LAKTGENDEGIFLHYYLLAKTNLSFGIRAGENDEDIFLHYYLLAKMDLSFGIRVGPM